MKILRTTLFRLILAVVAVLAALALLYFLIAHGQQYFSLQSIREMGLVIRSFGILSPLAVIFLVILSTIVPPLPLPIPLIEIAAGAIFGFWPGFFLIWFSQVFSSLIAFEISRVFRQLFFSRVFDRKIWRLYQQYLDRKGPVAVLIIRTAMAAPFNIISYLAGLTHMKTLSFTVMTALGTILESVLFVFVGTQLRNIHLSLWYLFILMVVLGALGSLLTFLMMKFLTPDLEFKR